MRFYSRFFVACRAVAREGGSIRGYFLRLLRLFAAINLLLFPVVSSYALTVDRSQEQLHSLPLANATPNPAQLPTTTLNQEMDRVLEAPEYAWRTPRQVELAPGWLEQLQNWLKNSLATLDRALARLGRAIANWFSSLFPQNTTLPTANGDGVVLVSQILSWVAIVGAAIVLILILIKVLPRRLATAPPKLQPAATPAPDLESEETTADELPEDEWIRLARQRADEGDLRQALRALFLAALSLLGTQGLVLIRRSKSNFDYERELRRKQNAVPGLNDIFSADRKLFERCWYGAHPVTAAEFEESDSLYQRLKHVCLRNNR